MFWVDVVIQLARPNNVGVLTDIPLTNHDLTCLEPYLLHHVLLPRFLLLVRIAENEVARNGILDPAGLVNGFWKHQERFCAFIIDDNEFWADGGSLGGDCGRWREEVVPRSGRGGLICNWTRARAPISGIQAGARHQFNGRVVFDVGDRGGCGGLARSLIQQRVPRRVEDSKRSRSSEVRGRW